MNIQFNEDQFSALITECFAKALQGVVGTQMANLLPRDPPMNQNLQDSDILMSEEELAHWANLSLKTIRTMRKSGLLPYIKFGKCPRYDKRSVIDALTIIEMKKRKQL